MGDTVFISYGHRDMASTDWLDRLKMYLAPFRRSGGVETWADNQIPAGSDWRLEIRRAIEKASVAVLLVGPGFLASEFIATEELPSILDRMTTQHQLRTFPLIVGYSSYYLSPLAKFQAFNNPSNPLEALSLADQNKILNELSTAIAEHLRESKVPASQKTQGQSQELATAMRQIQQHLRNTRTAFVAQCNRRDELLERMTQRLNIRNHMQFEKFFFKYFSEMDDEEHFEFDQIRAITEGSLYKENAAILQILTENPDLFHQLPDLAALQQHLVFWLNKYEKLFAKRPEMCLLYTGVEDGVPFPPGLDKKVTAWLAKQGG